MKHLTSYIKESIDENLFWKLDTWFRSKPEQHDAFIDLIKKYKDTKSINVTLSFDLKPFINFLLDDIPDEVDKDYEYDLENVIKTIIGNKNNSYNV